LIFKRIQPPAKTQFQFLVFMFVEDNIPQFQSKRIQPQAETQLYFSVVRFLEDNIPQFESERIQHTTYARAANLAGNLGISDAVADTLEPLWHLFPQLVGVLHEDLLDCYDPAAPKT